MGKMLRFFDVSATHVLQIDDLKKPYESYCIKYCCGFDSWEPIQSNAKLGAILDQFSSSHPAPSNGGMWTLDALFLLPKLRLKYYLKLYNRLLKNTDNRLLVNAVEALHDLLDTAEGRSSIKVGNRISEIPAQTPLETEDEVVIDMRNQPMSPPIPTVKVLPSNVAEVKTGSETSSNHGSISAG